MAATAWAGRPARVRAADADVLRVGLIGCGRQGKSVAKAMAAVPGVEIAAVCDPDAGRCEAAREESGAGMAATDLRRVLDRPEIDAVIIATPDHWHAPAALLALAAGKHVYLEKPCSHSFHEAELLRTAAATSGLVIQHGTQSRSNPLIARAVQFVGSGLIGDVLVAKAWNVQRRQSIGHDQPSHPPPGVEYDLWVGPAPLVPFQANRFHYNWRWWHAFGCGDIGNDGTHELDCARWGLGIDTLPTRVTGLGGKYHFDDDQQFPDTASLAFEFPPARAGGHPRQLLFEMRLWSGNYPHNCDSGVEFHGTEGMLFVSKRGKLELLDGQNKRRELPEPDGPLLEGSHQADFVAAIREQRKPRADMHEAFLSVALVHYGNIAVRLERGLRIDPPTGLIVDDPAASALLGREYRPGHWAAPREES
ncbi:MAG: 4-carboxy-2-hydroxymuconate-6-semialdehyde dehydrogenase [Planctomycetota bacterium]